MSEIDKQMGEAWTVIAMALAIFFAGATIILTLVTVADEDPCGYKRLMVQALLSGAAAISLASWSAWHRGMVFRLIAILILIGVTPSIYNALSRLVHLWGCAAG